MKDLREEVGTKAYSPYSRILRYWIDSEAAPANGGSDM